MMTQTQILWPEGQILPTFPASAETQDLIYLNDRVSNEERYLFSSLKGIVNGTQPRIFSYEGDAFAEGPYTWLDSLGYKYVEHDDPWAVLQKYLPEVEGLIVYDPDQIHTVNLATIMAKDKKALIASPNLLAKLTAAPYNLPVLEDLRGKYTSHLDLYQMIYDTYWQTADRRALMVLAPGIEGSVREYAIALKTVTVWLNPEIEVENELLSRFLSSMPQGANTLGWWPEEGPGVEAGSRFGIPTIPSNFCTNLTFHSGLPRTITPKPLPPKPELQNKIYVAFILSDGDNLQYVEHLMRKLWNNEDRGSVPIGWTISPAMVDAMPGALNFLHQSATENDNLISGPSGLGYTYPNYWPNTEDLNQYIERTEKYNQAAGIRVITVWNTITGGIDQQVGEAYAKYAPTTLGLTAQNTGGEMSIYLNSLPGKPLTCNYCTQEQAMLDHIYSGSEGWDGVSPRFLIIQAQPWQDVRPTSFKNVMNALNDNYIVVRPDHIFQLIREANNLPVNPEGN
ncbi:MAG: hypothetical protein LUH10_08920 [Tannerellaceae bacterium]|nr:hypothetical protein [Tannerellaceae bacterium]